MLDWLGKERCYKALGFGAKKCEICRDVYNDKCHFESEGKYAHADQVIPQMDGSGIDVITTVINNGYEEHGVQGWGDASGFKAIPNEKGGRDWFQTGIKFYGMILIDR